MYTYTYSISMRRFDERAGGRQTRDEMRGSSIDGAAENFTWHSAKYVPVVQANGNFFKERGGMNSEG